MNHFTSNHTTLFTSQAFIYTEIINTETWKNVEKNVLSSFSKVGGCFLKKIKVPKKQKIDEKYFKYIFVELQQQQKNKIYKIY